MAATLDFTLLGTPQILRDGTPLKGFVSSKAQALLFYLALTARPHTRQALAALLWGEMPESDARANLRVTLFNLRRLVAEHLDIRRESVAFNRDSIYRIDVDAFQSQINVSIENEPALRLAVNGYRGEFLEGFHVRDAPLFEEWMLIQRERLRQLAMQALYLLAQRTAEQGDYPAGIAYTSRLLALEPWQEEAHRHLMLLLALSGQRSAALEQYRACRRILATDLGVEPAEETTALYERIRSENRRAASGVPPGAARLPFVGRADEHLWLVQQCDEAQQSHATLTLIEGEAGIGKTRLTDELLHYAVGRGDAMVRGRCYPFAATMPYQPIIDALRTAVQTYGGAFAQLPHVWRIALASLLPELTVDGETPSFLGSYERGGRQILFEAVARCLIEITATAGSGHQTILFIDDLHYADAATIDLLLSLAFRLENEPIWLLGAYRVEALSDDHPAIRLRRSLGREQRLAILRLGPLTPEAVRDLVGALPGIPPTMRQQTTDMLWSESEGNPFVLSQLIAEHARPPTTGIARVPFAVEEMILERIDRLSRPGRRLLDLVAAYGPAVDVTALLASDDSDDPVQALQDCIAHGLLCVENAARSGGAPTIAHCTFTHGMIRRVVTARLTPWLRTSLTTRPAATQTHPAPVDDLLRRLVRLPHDLSAEP